MITEQTGRSDYCATMRVTIGVDPGVKGALVVLADGEPSQFIDMPTLPRKNGGNEVDPFRLAATLRGVMQRYPGAHCMAVIETIAMRPTNSRGSDQKAGEGSGIVKGVLGALGIRWVHAYPQTWKRYYHLLKTEKDIARQLAMNNFPGQAQWLCRKIDNGRADALLIARWAWETEQHADIAA